MAEKVLCDRCGKDTTDYRSKAILKDDDSERAWDMCWDCQHDLVDWLVTKVNPRAEVAT